MAYFITDACISCGSCEPECPVKSISTKNNKYIIDENICIECSTYNSVCPVDAPQPEK